MTTPVLLRIVCAAEAATGLALLVDPPTVIGLLLGSDITGAGLVISRIAGIALIALALACWPGGTARGLQGMVVYNLGVATYMAVVGLGDGPVGVLWWPACAAHAVLAVLLVRALLKK